MHTISEIKTFIFEIKIFIFEIKIFNFEIKIFNFEIKIFIFEIKIFIFLIKVIIFEIKIIIFEIKSGNFNIKKCFEKIKIEMFKPKIKSGKKNNQSSHFFLIRYSSNTVLQSGSGVQIQLTPKQRGAFLGTLLASIGVPLLLKALTGRGLHVDPTTPRSTKSVYVPPQQEGKGKKREERACCSGKTLPSMESHC